MNIVGQIHLSKERHMPTSEPIKAVDHDNDCILIKKLMARKGYLNENYRNIKVVSN